MWHRRWVPVIPLAAFTMLLIFSAGEEMAYLAYGGPLSGVQWNSLLVSGGMDIAWVLHWLGYSLLTWRRYEHRRTASGYPRRAGRRAQLRAFGEAVATGDTESEYRADAELRAHDARARARAYVGPEWAKRDGDIGPTAKDDLPLYPTRVIGYRYWSLRREWLQPLTMDIGILRHSWATRHGRIVCPYVSAYGDRPDHGTIPGERCVCGCYANWLWGGTMPARTVEGMVAATGKVIPHDTGLRAEKMEILALRVHVWTKPRTVKLLRQRYRVPVYRTVIGFALGTRKWARDAGQ